MSDKIKTLEEMKRAYHCSHTTFDEVVRSLFDARAECNQLRADIKEAAALILQNDRDEAALEAKLKEAEDENEKLQSDSPLMSDYLTLKTAAKNLLIACEHQDNCENLCEKIDGKLLDDLREADKKDPLVTVCAACRQACCWQGIFICDRARDAGTIQLYRSELAKLGLESSDYWEGE